MSRWPAICWAGAAWLIPVGLCAQVVELDPSNAAMAAKVRRLEPIVAARREKMKEEMMGACCINVVVRMQCACYAHTDLHECSLAGKLKDLGNTVLGKFGMSLDNFKAEKDPNTGSYSIQFKQN